MSDGDHMTNHLVFFPSGFINNIEGYKSRIQSRRNIETSPETKPKKGNKNPNNRATYQHLELKLNTYTPCEKPKDKLS